jgi:hypothetical protein
MGRVCHAFRRPAIRDVLNNGGAMTLLAPLRRRLQRLRSAAPALTPRPLRVQVCPPEVQPARIEPQERASPAPGSLPQVRDEFVEMLCDVPGSAELCVRLAHARSLRELWHLRADLFNRVALFHDQDEAETRLARLNRHFPARAPLSGFAAL